MRLFDARTAIHDAFAINAKMAYRLEVGQGTDFDSDRAAFNGMKAGLIINAVLKQSAPFRGCAMLINAHDGTANTQEVYAFKIRVWEQFIKNAKTTARGFAEVHAIADQLIIGYRQRTLDHRSTRNTVPSLAAVLGASPKAIERICANSLIYLDGLEKIDRASLIPVQEVINDQREKYYASIDQGSK